MDWYSMSAADAVGKLGSSVDRGLSSREAEKRLGQDGENILRGKKKKSIIAEFFEQFKDFTVIVLLIASGVSFATSFLEEHGDFADPIMILIIVILNAAVGVIQQRRAEHSLDALFEFVVGQSLCYHHAIVDQYVVGDIKERERV